MVFEHIEKMKQTYTDQYVVVDGTRPELARFSGQTGQVRTVNMSGRALVEFDQYANIGWYDIDVDYLKVVDKPAPKAPEAKTSPKKKAAPKKAAGAAGTEKLSPLELARMQGAAGGKKKTAEKTKPSTADILAAARGGAKATSSSSDAAKPESAPASKKTSEMSLAEKLAAARGGSQPAAPEAPAAAEPEGVADAPAEERVSDPAPEADALETPAAVGKVDRNSMSVEEKVDWCRKQDGG